MESESKKEKKKRKGETSFKFFGFSHFNMFSNLSIVWWHEGLYLPILLADWTDTFIIST